MGVIVNITDDIKATVQQVFDDILLPAEEGGLGKHCRLIYPSKMIACENCVFDPTTNRSSNRPKSGAPIPFGPGGVCPMCNATGKMAEEHTEDVVFKCSWAPKRFMRLFPKIEMELAQSLVETKGYVTDIPKILQAERLVVDTSIEAYLRQTYKLFKSPGSPSNIIQGRYFMAYWEQVGA